MSDLYDLLIIGGGINGCGIARDAAGRGYSVYLCEMDDLASGTSSWSTKLIHGGLRYLEYYEFRLVREALLEREVLWGIAPHIIGPMRFVLPHHQGLRPAWLLRLGLFLYDHIGGRKHLPPTRTLDLARDVAGVPLHPGLFTRGFEYSDCFVDDARLVALNARDAANRGAQIETRTRALATERGADEWRLTVEDQRSGARKTVRGRVLVNAAGPWVDHVLTGVMRANAKAHVRLVQGSHIVVPKLYEHDRSYIFQNADGRIVFAIPYQDQFTLIGTTDRDYAGDPAAVVISAEEITYLCSAASAYFARPIREEDVVWSYSGVRPLYDDGASEAKAATRDYVLERDASEGRAAHVSVFGGKITTYRRLAESVLECVQPSLPHREGQAEGWTGTEPLPGGDFERFGLSSLIEGLLSSHPFLHRHEAVGLVRRHGTLARTVLGAAQDRSALGPWFGPLSGAEVRYLVAQEWARTPEDVLWRRSKLGLVLSADEQRALTAYMTDLMP